MFSGLHSWLFLTMDCIHLHIHSIILLHKNPPSNDSLLTFPAEVLSWIHNTPYHTISYHTIYILSWSTEHHKFFDFFHTFSFQYFCLIVSRFWSLDIDSMMTKLWKKENNIMFGNWTQVIHHPRYAFNSLL